MKAATFVKEGMEVTEGFERMDRCLWGGAEVGGGRGGGGVRKCAWGAWLTIMSRDIEL